MSAQKAEACFSVDHSTAGRWHKMWREEKRLEAREQGQPRGSKLDRYEDLILFL